MAEQYVARDKRTDLEIQVTGDFPPHPDDRIRIARTTTLFTRLMSTILSTVTAGGFSFSTIVRYSAHS